MTDADKALWIRRLQIAGDPVVLYALERSDEKKRLIRNARKIMARAEELGLIKYPEPKPHQTNEQTESKATG